MGNVLPPPHMVASATNFRTGVKIPLQVRKTVSTISRPKMSPQRHSTRHLSEAYSTSTIPVKAFQTSKIKLALEPQRD